LPDRQGTRATVLVVDDERGPRESLRLILQPSHRVLAAESGSQALGVLRSEPVDVVTLDLAMPGLRGADLMRTIRSEFPDVEVVVVTGHGSLESATEGIRCGVADYLPKPFDVVQVTAAVYRALARRRGRGRLVRFLEELGELVGRDRPVGRILAQLEGDAELGTRMGELLVRSAAELAPEAAPDPERALPFFEVLAEAIESQDPFQRGHARRTAFLVGVLADRLGLPGEEGRSARIAAFLHDIGKIGVPTEYLARRGALTAEERRAVQRHADVGARLLAPLGLGEELVAAVRHHHERWDGRGYPDGLAGESIPLAARLISLADAFDAMTCERPHRRALTQAAAIAEIERDAGAHFDPSLAKEFLALVESGACDLDLGVLADAAASAESLANPFADLGSAAPLAARRS
jgi:putative nucleotidyltransferase with HDIG domain